MVKQSKGDIEKAVQLYRDTPTSVSKILKESGVSNYTLNKIIKERGLIKRSTMAWKDYGKPQVDKVDKENAVEPPNVENLTIPVEIDKVDTENTIEENLREIEEIINEDSNTEGEMINIEEPPTLEIEQSQEQKPEDIEYTIKDIKQSEGIDGLPKLQHESIYADKGFFEPPQPNIENLPLNTDICRNLRIKIKMYLFDPQLCELVASIYSIKGGLEKFLMNIEKMNENELTLTYQEMEGFVSAQGLDKLLFKSYIGGCFVVETLTKKLMRMKTEGYAQHMYLNAEVPILIKQIRIKHWCEIEKYISPENRLLAISAMGLYETSQLNKAREKVDEKFKEEVKDEVLRSYEDLDD